MDAAQQQVEQYEPGKMFVGGLSWVTTNETMRAYFSHFGEVDDCVVMKDQNQPAEMKRNKGFGFVTFKNPASVEEVKKCSLHTLDGKKIDPKPAVHKGGAVGGGIGGNTNMKVFLGGLSSETTEDDVKAYFEALFLRKKFSAVVTDVDFKVDKATNHMRGFGFVGFDTTGARDLAVQERYHDIRGKRVEAKPALPRGSLGNPNLHSTQGTYAYPGYPQPTDFRGASNGQQYHPSQYYGGPAGGQYYHYQQQPQASGYGQQYTSTPNYSYDPSAAYPPTQPSTGERPDTQSFYQQPSNHYGHGGNQQQPSAYAQDTTSYTGRSAYPPTQDGYGQQMPTGYSRGAGQPPAQQPQPPQPQPHYAVGRGYGL